MLFQCILNALLESIKPFNTTYVFVCIDCSIREYQSDFSPLCWHNMPACYALNYAGIFDGGLLASMLSARNGSEIHYLLGFSEQYLIHNSKYQYCLQ